MEKDTTSVYEQLITTLYAYRLGSISFIELVERFETVLDISHQAEVPDFDGPLDEGESDRRKCPSLAPAMLPEINVT